MGNKSRLCPDCQVKGNFEFMLYSRSNRRYICSKCKGVWTPISRDDDVATKLVEDEIGELMRELYSANLPTKEPIPAGRAAKGGGGKTKGRSRKMDMRKKSVNKLYKEL